MKREACKVERVKQGKTEPSRKISFLFFVFEWRVAIWGSESDDMGFIYIANRPKNERLDLFI